MNLFSIKELEGSKYIYDSKSHFVKPFIKVAGYFENIGKAKQNLLFKRCMSMRLFLASTSLLPNLLFSKLLSLHWLLKKTTIETGCFYYMTLVTTRLVCSFHQIQK